MIVAKRDANSPGLQAEFLVGGGFAGPSAHERPLKMEGVFVGQVLRDFAEESGGG